MRVLYLSGNRISDTGFKSLSDALRINRGIRALYLSANFCGTDGTVYLANSLKENSYLHTLCLNGNNIQTTGAYHLSQTLLSNNTITHLNLSANNIGDEGLSHIALALQSQKQIQVLELSFNGITEIGISSLCSSLRGHPCSKLMLDNNKIKDNGAFLIAEILEKSSLKILSVAYNDIAAVGISSIVKKLIVSDEINLTNNNWNGLEWLDLRGNSLIRESITLIATMLSKNFTLQSLFLDAKSLSENGIIELTVGIVSNYKPSLIRFEGFLLGPSIVDTLHFPPNLSNLSNESVLKYLKEAWMNGEAHNLLTAFENSRIMSASPSSADIDMLSDSVLGSSWNDSYVKIQSMARLSSGSLQFQVDSKRQGIYDKMMTTVTDLNCSPSFDIIHNCADLTKRILSNTLGTDSVELTSYIKALKEIVLLPYDATALWELHQYYFSPPTSTSLKDLKRQNNLTDIYHDLSSGETTSSDDESSNHHKRRIIQMLGTSPTSPKKKHRKRPMITTRISYYPRLKHQLDIYKSESNDVKTLSLLRQLRLLEEEYDVEQQEVPLEHIILNLLK